MITFGLVLRMCRIFMSKIKHYFTRQFYRFANRCIHLNKWGLYLLTCLSPVVLAQDGPPPAPVVVAEVEETELAPTVWVAGSVISRNDAQVPAEVDGRLVWVVEVGTHVKNGADLAKIDNTLTTLELAEFEAEVERVGARIRFLEQEVARLQRLAKRNNAAQTLLEETIANRDTARGERAVALARLAQARVRLERSAVKAPFDGTVVERRARPGEWVDSGNAVVRLVDPNAVEVQARVPIASMPFLRRGVNVRIKVEDNVVSATTRSLVPIGDAQSRLLDLRLDFDEPSWPVGQTVRVAVPTAAARTVLAVPRDALVLRRTGAAVFKIGPDDTAQRVEVITGIASGSLIEIKGDIQTGDRIVIRGGERMRPGQKVVVVTTSNES